MFSGTDIPEAAWAGQIIYRTDTQGLQVYNGTAWEDVVGGAFGVLTYVGPDIPVANGAGDLWFDTDDGRKMYVARVAGADQIIAGEWELVQDSATAQATADTAQTTANNANTLAGTKNKTFVQTSPPTALVAGDIWLDSDDGYKMYRAAVAGATTIGAGQWEMVQDAAINTAQTTANGKNKVYYQAAAPTGGTYVVGDTWFDTDDGYKPYNWDGSAWQPMTFGSSALAVDSVTAAQILAGAVNADKISSDYIYAGQISAGQVDAGTLAADYLVAGNMSTGVAPDQRVTINSTGLLLYGPSNDVRINFSTTSPEAYIRANIVSRGLTVEDGMTVQGEKNILAMGSVTTLQTTITGSSTAATATNGFVVQNPSGFGQYLLVPQAFCAQGTLGSSAAIDIMDYQFFGTHSIKVSGSTVYNWPTLDRGDGTVQANWRAFGGMADVYLSGVGAVRHVQWGQRTLGGNVYQNVLRTYNMTGVNATTAPTQMGSDVTVNPFNSFLWGKIGRNLNVNNAFVMALTGSSTDATSTIVTFRKYNVDGTTGAISVDTTMPSPWSGNSLVKSWGNSGTTYGIKGVVFGTATSMGFATDSTDVFVVGFREDTNGVIQNWARVFRASDGLRLPNYDFPLNPDDGPFTAARSSATGGYGGFKGVKSNDGSTMTEHTEITWTTESSKWWSSYTWRDTLTYAVQQVVLNNATGGTFTLSFKGLANEITETTAAINYNATAAQVQTALENLASLTPGDVVVKGGPLPGAIKIYFSSDATYTELGVVTPIQINLTSAYGGRSLATMTSTSSLTGTSPTISITDGSTQHESTGSTFTSWTMEKRKAFTLTTPSLPSPAAGTQYARGHDDVSGVNFYVGRLSTQPATTAMYKRTTQPAEGAITYTYTTMPSFSGTTLSSAGPAFPASASAVIQSSAVNSTTSLPKIKISGDGFVHAENLDVSGGGVAYIEKLILSSTTDASASAGNQPPLRVGNTSGIHLRIDGNEIQPMNDDTTGGNLILAQSAGTVQFGGGGNTFSRIRRGSNSVTAGGGNGTATITHGSATSSAPDAVVGSARAAGTNIGVQFGTYTTTTFTVTMNLLSDGSALSNGSTKTIEWIAIWF
jgi:hypothetical protein